jgi:hypothetical protein
MESEKLADAIEAVLKSDGLAADINEIMKSDNNVGVCCDGVCEKPVDIGIANIHLDQPKQILVVDDDTKPDAESIVTICDVNADVPIKRVEEKKLKICDIPSILKGDRQLPGETFEEFKTRRKEEHKLLDLRLRAGVARLGGGIKDKTKKTKPYRSEERQFKKIIAQRKDDNRKGLVQERRLQRKSSQKGS